MVIFINNYSVTLCIIDRVCCNNSVNTLQKEVTITSLNTTILLQNNYTLNVLSVNENRICVIIQDGINTYVLNIYTTFKSEICLCSSKNSSHKLTVSAVINEV